MQGQERGARKNYIAILNDVTDEQRPVESPAKSDRRLRDYFLGLMTAMLRRQGGAR
jgi:hypothetical protein